MLRIVFAGLVTLAPTASAFAQQTTAVDYSTMRVLPGSWGYRAIPGGSEARFADTAGIAQLTIGCTRATRQIALARASGTAGQGLFVWTSNAARTLPARFDPRGMRLIADLAANDPLLDSLAFSRGRIAVTIVGGSVVVAPAWPEAARVIEDCRT
jgi:hypothetical protein